MSIIATDCINDISTRIKALGEFGATGKEKVFSVYSEDDLLDKSKMLKFPCIGVMYEGIRANSLDGSRQGMAADCGIALVLLLESKSIGGINRENEAARLLDSMRESVRLSRAPSQHKWRFVSEMPAGVVGAATVYVQRWTCPVILTN